MPKKTKEKKPEASIPNNNNKIIVPTMETGAPTALSVEMVKNNKESVKSANVSVASNSVSQFNTP